MVDICPPLSEQPLLQQPQGKHDDEKKARHFLRAKTTDVTDVTDILETLEALNRVEPTDTGYRVT